MYFYLMFLLLQYTNLCYSSVNSLKKRNFKWERKLIFSQAAWVFFSYFITDRHILKEAHYLSKWYHNEYKQHMICYSAIQSSIYPNNFSVEKKLQKWYLFIWRVSDMITSSRISLIIFFIKHFCLIKRLKVTAVFT